MEWQWLDVVGDLIDHYEQGRTLINNLGPRYRQLGDYEPTRHILGSEFAKTPERKLRDIMKERSDRLGQTQIWQRR
jgi:hypothetical protein